MSEAEMLRKVIAMVASHEWIIATAFNDTTRDFGYQVNEADGPPRKGTQHYKALRETFALTPAEAGLNGLRLREAVHVG